MIIGAIGKYNVLLFLFAVCHSQTAMDEIELLKCKINALEKSNNALEKSYDWLEKSYAAVQEEIKELKSGVIKEMKLKLDSLETGDEMMNLTQIMQEASTLSAYCKTLPSNICGKCTCLDDYALDKRYYCDCQHLPAARDCLEHLKAGYSTSGVYKVNTGGIKDMQVYCDQDTDHGGWTVFQRRINGEINFYRNWQLYKQGFGTVQREFWLGNDNIYVLSLEAAYPKGSELRVDLIDWEGRSYHANYIKFSVDSEEENYKLLVEGYQGNCGDSLGYHSGGLFSTYDTDNDVHSSDCSENYMGGWWYKACHHANLNGAYLWRSEGLENTKGLTWYHLHNKHISMKHVEMKLRRKL